MSAQNPASLPSSSDASPEPAPTPTPPTNGPQTANLGDGAIGQLNEWKVVDALLACLPMHADGTGHIVDCGFDWEVTAPCGCASLPGRLAAVVSEHTERALAEVEQRIDQCGVRTDSAERWGIITALHIVRDYRAARQEKGR